jgi:hypothetical protein
MTTMATSRIETNARLLWLVAFRLASVAGVERVYAVKEVEPVRFLIVIDERDQDLLHQIYTVEESVFGDFDQAIDFAVLYRSGRPYPDVVGDAQLLFFR